MIRNILLLALLLALAGLYTYHADRTAPAAPAADLGPAPDFTVTSIAGHETSLSDHRGRVVVVNFWASWCAPCVVEFPAMLALAASMENETSFLFLSFDKDDEAIRKFMARHKLKPTRNVVIARDEAMTAAQAYGTVKLPESYIIDSGGRITRKIVGADYPWDSREARAMLARLM